MHRIRFSALLLLASLAFTGCKSESLGRMPLSARAPAYESASFAPSISAAKGREVIGSAWVALEVADAQAARVRIQAQAEALGGFAASNEAMRIVVKIPVARMKEAADALAKIGRVVNSSWKSEDATGAGDDLRAHLQEVQAEIARLRALLATAKDGSAQANLNAQLQAAQREEALLAANLRRHSNQTAMATLEVRLQNDPALAGLANDIQVRWVRELTQVLERPRSVNLDFKPDFDWHSVDATLPPGFIKFRDCDYVVEAVDADSTRLRITRHDNPAKAGSGFWFPLVRRGVAEGQGMKVAEEKDVVAADKHAARLVVGERGVGRAVMADAVCVAVGEKYVYTVECWGRKEEVAALRAKLEACIVSLRVK